VDHLHATIAGTHGDLLGPIGVTVKTGLAHQQLDAAAEAVRDALDLAPDGLKIGFPGRGGGAARPRPRPGLTQHAAGGLSPLAGGDAGLGARNRWLHDVAPVPGRGFERRQRPVDRRPVAPGAPGLKPRDLLGLDGGVDRLHGGTPGGERRGFGLDPAIDPNPDPFATFYAPRNASVARAPPAFLIV